MSFEFFEHTADIGVRVTGATLPELFIHAARAMYAALGELQKSAVSSQQSMELRAETLEDLLHDWLQELLFEIEARQTQYDVMTGLQIREGEAPAAPPSLAGIGSAGASPSPGRWTLTATLRGGPIDFSRSRVREEIKAVTYHQLRVEQRLDGAWQATVIFDV